jgi:hypothetical protein
LRAKYLKIGHPISLDFRDAGSMSFDQNISSSDLHDASSSGISKSIQDHHGTVSNLIVGVGLTHHRSCLRICHLVLCSVHGTPYMEQQIALKTEFRLNTDLFKLLLKYHTGYIPLLSIDKDLSSSAV